VRLLHLLAGPTPERGVTEGIREVFDDGRGAAG
jgi:hypothetical protein